MLPLMVLVQADLLEVELETISSTMIDTVVHTSKEVALDTMSSSLKGTIVTVSYVKEGVSCMKPIVGCMILTLFLQFCKLQTSALQPAEVALCLTPEYTAKWLAIVRQTTTMSFLIQCLSYISQAGSMDIQLHVPEAYPHSGQPSWWGGGPDLQR